MNWLQSELAKMVIRTLFASVGGAVVAKGYLSNSEVTDVVGALAVIVGVVHHLWTERSTIAEDLSKTKTPPAVKLLIGVAIPALLLSGCANTQVIDNTSGTGLNTSASVPIPYSGGQSLLMVKLTAGMWKNSAIIQPVSTNRLSGPSVSIAQYTKGSASTTASASTNSSAGIVGASVDVNLITTGTSSVDSTNVSLESKQ
jgi:hypothetical protein